MGRRAGWGRTHRHLCGGGEKGPHLCWAGMGRDLSHARCSVRWGQKVPSTGTAVNHSRSRGQITQLAMEASERPHPFPWAVMEQVSLYGGPTVYTLHLHIRWISPLERQGQQVQSRELGLSLDLPALPYPPLPYPSTLTLLKSLSTD